ncbi:MULTISPECIES: hypothetical protein [Bacillus]|uniref:hypothetical protein n=1 Tax=Bacillus TaxID=1386 RepID=UPI0003112762|nr:hypothetical protein [Bacillus safensis]MEE3607383.1 hypothetical protein [Bacillus altitudinis]MCY7710840.1 hypothetical protein [Bacillus safensis]MCY7727205.1 hypothetical protein [Bacillus safensis]MEE3613562.1 hypothetical protein [Bacillus altitudinis]MEE3649153.1 hypothetical protein [Bacillus altitudinis]
MVENIVGVLVFLLKAVQVVAGSYAAFKLGLYGVGYMTKNQRKIDEAKDGMKNVVIGIVIVAGAAVAVSWLQGNIGF